MSASRFVLVALVLLASACSRTFPAPADAPAGIEVLDPVAAGDGGAVLRQPNGIYVVSGVVRLGAVAQPGSGEVKAVDFWTPGFPHVRDAGFDWAFDTRRLYPSGGVMTLYVTAYDRHGQPTVPVERSYVVDNAPPQLSVTSPVPGSTLPPGSFNVVFCAQDRPDVTRIDLDVQVPLADGSVQSFKSSDAGPGCFVTDPIAIDLDGRSEVPVTISAADDVHNVARTTVTYGVTRELQRGTLAGTAPVDGNGTPLPNTVASFVTGHGVALMGTLGPVESWIGAGEPALRYLPSTTTIPFPIPGSDGRFVELSPRGDGGTLSESMRLPDGGAQVTLLGALPAGFSSLVDLDFGSGPSGLCVASRAFQATQGSVAPLVCLDPSGSVRSADLPAASNGARYVGVFPGSVVVEYVDVNASYHLTRFRLDGGLTREADLLLPSDIITPDCTTSVAGVVCGGRDLVSGLHVDAETGAVETLPAPDNGTVRLDAAPHGGVLYAVNQLAKGQVDLEERWSDGGAALVGCLDPAASAFNAFKGVRRYDLHDHLYIFYADSHLTGHLRAFGPGGILKWEWTTPNVATAGQASDPVFALTLDPLADPNAPGETVLVTLDSNTVLLARQDPRTPPPKQCVR